MKACSILCLLLLVAFSACSKARSTYSANVLGAATIGPAGGEIVVTAGKQAGLRLSVPAGALQSPVELRVLDIDVPVLLPANLLATTYIASPGDPFRIEPAEQLLDVAATLRMPYATNRVSNTSVGNVRCQQIGSFGTRSYDPQWVDVGAGWLDVRIKTLGRFQVVLGPQRSVDNYLPQLNTTVPLTDGFTFTYEAAPATTPRFGGAGVLRLRLQGDGIDERFYWDGSALRGRECATADWQEVWNEPYALARSVGPASSPGSTVATQVFSPISAVTGFAGQITTWAYWAYGEPRLVGTRVIYDTLRLQVSLAWVRSDLGLGQSDYGFLFAPGLGLLEVRKDGVVHARTGL